MRFVPRAADRSGPTSGVVCARSKTSHDAARAQVDPEILIQNPRNLIEKPRKVEFQRAECLQCRQLPWKSATPGDHGAVRSSPRTL